jgi:hypothetical protein
MKLKFRSLDKSWLEADTKHQHPRRRPEVRITTKIALLQTPLDPVQLMDAVSPPMRVAIPRHAIGSTVLVMNLTEPSHNPALTPPEWRLRAANQPRPWAPQSAAGSFGSRPVLKTLFQSRPPQNHVLPRITPQARVPVSHSAGLDVTSAPPFNQPPGKALLEANVPVFRAT